MNSLGLMINSNYKYQLVLSCGTTVPVKSVGEILCCDKSGEYFCCLFVCLFFPVVMITQCAFELVLVFWCNHST